MLCNINVCIIDNICVRVHFGVANAVRALTVINILSLM